jgi:acyl-CoA synthetase (NDP forming)
VVFTSGFAEVGSEGAAEEARIAAFARESGRRVVGPNSPGFVNVTDTTCVIASGVGFRPSFRAGGIGLLSQSGGAAGLLIERLQDSGAGTSVALCTGNEADVTVGEALQWLAAHEPTRVVGMFLEGFRQLDELTAGFEALHEAGKTAVVLKAGATAAAARASASHTGALATEDEVVDAYLERHGVARVHGFDELIDAAVALERLGPARGRRVGILSTSGGAGVVATEAAERAGLELPPLQPATAGALKAVMPDFAALGNPADMSGMFSERPEIFRESLRIVTEAEEFDTAVMVLTVHPPEPSERLADLILSCDVSDLAVLWTAGKMAEPSMVRLSEAGVAVFQDAERAMKALAARADVGRAAGAALPRPGPAPELPDAAALTERETLAILEGGGVPVARTIACASAQDAARAAVELGGRVVVKASARDLPHKSDAGAVVVGVEGAQAGAAAHDEVVAAAKRAGATPEGSIVQAFAPAGVELIVGARRDPVLGPVLVVAPGGTLAELIGGAARRMLPLHAGEARAMLDELRIAPLLRGYRGGAAADLDAAAAAIEALAQLAVACGDAVADVEINPLVVHPAGEGVTAVDGLLLRA